MLLRLVDSRDIVELELKQLDCEIVIRKKEALPQQPAPVYHSMMPPPPMAGLPMPPSPPVSPPAPSSANTATAPSSSHSPLKSPMAGTFYRSPGPGEPPFVKVQEDAKKKRERERENHLNEM